MRSFAAIVLAGISSGLMALSTSLQALEARDQPRETALRAALLERLVRRRTWLLGALAGVGAWLCQAAALTFGSIALVQPALGLGLVVLLFLGVRILHEHVGRREKLGVAAIVASIAVLGWAAPATTGAFTHTGVVVVIVWVALVAAAPQILRALHFESGLVTAVVAGLGWAAVGLATALLDDALAHRHWLVLLAWGIAVAGASWGALLSEMTSLQCWPATRAIPIAFALEMVVPAAVAPLITEHGAGPYHGIPFAAALLVAALGATLLGSSRAVAGTVAAEAVPST
jgi:drug/metabolite transporter (DMT)-like permease